MISLCIYENDEELEQLKTRAKNKEKIYTVYKGQTVHLLENVKAQKIGKSELDNLISHFKIEEVEQKIEYKNTKIDSDRQPKDEPTIQETRPSFDKWCESIENDLNCIKQLIAEEKQGKV
jgi:hypothetical protein